MIRRISGKGSCVAAADELCEVRREEVGVEGGDVGAGEHILDGGDGMMALGSMTGVVVYADILIDGKCG